MRRIRARRSSVRTCSCSLLLLFGAAASGVAQGNAFAECNPDHVRLMSAAELGAWGHIAPDSLKMRFEPLRRAGRWSAIVDSLALLYGIVATADGTSRPPASLNGLSHQDSILLRAEVDSTREELRAGEIDSTARLHGQITAKRFAIESRVVAPPHYVRLFAGRPPGKPILIDSLAPATIRSICWLAIAVNDLTALYGADARAALADALARRATRWDNFSRGYSMTPIELFVNGYLPRPELEPPRYQAVLLHVSVGEEMLSDGPISASNLRRHTVLVLEPLGALRYLGDRYAAYAGLSWVIAYPDSGGVATGVTLHHSNVGHVSFLWRPTGPSRGNRGAVLLSLDAYRYLVGVAQKWKNLQGDAIAQCLANAPACIAQTP